MSCLQCLNSGWAFLFALAIVGMSLAVNLAVLALCFRGDP